MEANEREPWPGDEGGHAWQEFQWGHHGMGGAIALGRLALQHDRAGPGTAEPFVAEGRPRDIATELFEFLALMRTTPCPRMEAKPLSTHTALGLRHFWVCMAQRGVFPRQHFLSRPGAQGNAVGACRGLQAGPRRDRHWWG